MKVSTIFLIVELIAFAMGAAFCITGTLTPKPETYNVKTFLGIPYAYDLNPDFIHAFAHMMTFIIIGLCLMAFSFGVAITSIYIRKLEKESEEKD